MSVGIKASLEPNAETKTSVEKTKLHKYVLICVGCLFLMIGSLPIAWWRVSESGKYNGLPFKSLNLEDHQRVTPASIKLFTRGILRLDFILQ